MKRSEWQKKEYLKLAEVVNAYKSESVQLMLIDRLLPIIDRDFMQGEEKSHKEAKPDIPNIIVTPSGNIQKIGPTRAIKQIINSDFFNQPKTIGEIVNHCQLIFEGNFETNNVSGNLLKLTNEKKLQRVKDKGNARYAYLK